MISKKIIFKCDECGIEMEKPFLLELTRNSRKFKVDLFKRFLKFTIEGYLPSKDSHGERYHLCGKCTKKLVNQFKDAINDMDL